MEAKIFPYGGAVDYSFEVTVSDLVMADGKSLEHAGVTLDRVVVPLPEDLGEQRPSPSSTGRIGRREAYS
jgi:hypothetical protein